MSARSLAVPLILASAACGGSDAVHPVGAPTTEAPPYTFQLKVNVSGSGTGRVVSNPNGIDCPGTCSATFADGTTVSLSAAAGPIFRHRGWSGACGGLTCDLTMSADVEVTANFEPPRYKVIDLGPADGSDVEGRAISANGKYMAGSFTGPTPDRGLRGFFWDGDKHDLGSKGVVYVAAVNDSGVVAGSWFAAAGSTRLHAFRWRAGGFTDLGTLGGEDSEASDMNNDGIIVGNSSLPNGQSHAARWDSSGIVDLGSLGGNEAGSAAWAINSNGVIVGTSELGRTAPATRAAMNGDATPSWMSPPPPHHAVHFRGPGVIDDLGTLGGSYGYAADINDAGTIVGTSTLAGDAHYHGFIYENGRMIDVGTLPGMEYSELRYVNPAGIAVGTSFSPSSTSLKHLIYGGGKMLCLEDLIEDNFYWIGSLGGIDEAGNIVVTGIHYNFSRALLLQPE